MLRCLREPPCDRVVSRSLESLRAVRYEVTSMETGVGVIHLELIRHDVEVSAVAEKGAPLCERGVLTVRKQHGLGNPGKQSYTRPSPRSL
jgi:hypothetical protein